MLQPKAPRLPVLLKLDRVTTGEASAAVFGIGFQTSGFEPRSARCSAADNPANPPPMMTTSGEDEVVVKMVGSTE